MSVQDYLFVGGSRDGQRHPVDAGEDVVSVRVEQERSFPDASSPVVVEVGPTVEEVYQRSIRQVDGVMTEVFALEPL